MKKHLELQYDKYDDYKPIYLVNGDRDDLIIRASPLDKTWRKPGKVFCKLKSTGNGLVVDFEGHIIELNYCEAEILRIALKLYDPYARLYEVTKKEIK